MSARNFPKNPECYVAVLHRHPDGAGRVLHDRASSRLVVENELTGDAVVIPIGPAGLLALARGLIAEVEAQK